MRAAAGAPPLAAPLWGQPLPAEAAFGLVQRRGRRDRIRIPYNIERGVSPKECRKRGGRKRTADCDRGLRSRGQARGGVGGGALLGRSQVGE